MSNWAPSPRRRCLLLRAVCATPGRKSARDVLSGGRYRLAARSGRRNLPAICAGLPPARAEWTRQLLPEPALARAARVGPDRDMRLTAGARGHVGAHIEQACAMVTAVRRDQLFEPRRCSRGRSMLSRPSTGVRIDHAGLTPRPPASCWVEEAVVEEEEARMVEVRLGGRSPRPALPLASWLRAARPSSLQTRRR